MTLLQFDYLVYNFGIRAMTLPVKLKLH